jgi:hypothetical protein
MSIYVSISRRAYPFEENGPEISVDEWLQAVDGEKDFRLPIADECEGVGSHARVCTTFDPPVVFDFTSMGEIDVKNPSPPIIARMKRLAMLLNATVFSAEHGETFDDYGNHQGFVEEP